MVVTNVPIRFTREADLPDAGTAEGTLARRAMEEARWKSGSC